MKWWFKDRIRVECGFECAVEGGGGVDIGGGHDVDDEDADDVVTLMIGWNDKIDF